MSERDRLAGQLIAFCCSSSYLRLQDRAVCGHLLHNNNNSNTLTLL